MPSDYFLFPRVKAELRGYRFRNVADMRVGVLRTIRNIPKEDFRLALQTLPIHWMKCVKAEGNFFEGYRIQCDPDEFGLEMVWEEVDVEDSDEDD